MRGGVGLWAVDSSIYLLKRRVRWDSPQPVVPARCPKEHSVRTSGTPGWAYTDGGPTGHPSADDGSCTQGSLRTLLPSDTGGVSPTECPRVTPRGRPSDPYTS